MRREGRRKKRKEVTIIKKILIFISDSSLGNKSFCIGGVK